MNKRKEIDPVHQDHELDIGVDEKVVPRRRKLRGGQMCIRDEVE